MRWIAILVFLCLCGCQSTRLRVAVTRLNGEPHITVELIDEPTPKQPCSRDCFPSTK